MNVVVVEYLDSNNKKRWGYMSKSKFKVFLEYKNKLSELMENDGNEVLNEEVKRLSKHVVELYLCDGTTGDAEFRHITLTEDFANI